MSDPQADPKAYRYEVAPLPAEEGGGFVVSFPDIPGCLGVGDTEERRSRTASVCALLRSML